MIRALNTGVLGMRQFQQSLDVIGNNLANINTVAFKGAGGVRYNIIPNASSPDSRYGYDFGARGVSNWKWYDGFLH